MLNIELLFLAPEFFLTDNFFFLNLEQLKNIQTPSYSKSTVWDAKDIYLAHVIEQPNLRIPNPQYLQLNFCFDFFNDSENTFWGFFEI